MCDAERSDECIVFGLFYDCKGIMDFILMKMNKLPSVCS